MLSVAEPEPFPAQAPLPLMATESPELAVAATVKLLANAALAGAALVTVMVWVSNVAVPLTYTTWGLSGELSAMTTSAVPCPPADGANVTVNVHDGALWPLTFAGNPLPQLCTTL